MSRRLSLPLLAATALLLVVPAVAPAAYAPKLAAKIDPSTTGAAPALTTTVSQKSGETPSKTVVVHFPSAFGTQLGVSLTPCTSAQEQAKSCPAASKMGTAFAQTPLGAFKGGVYYGGTPGNKIRMIVFLSNGIALLDQKVIGTVDIQSTGISATFDNLPNVLTTTFRLSLAGGAKGLLLNPTACGDYAFKAGFTSQKGEKASADAPVSITGCPPLPPRLTALHIKPTKIRAGHSAKARFKLDQASTVLMRIRKGSHTIAKRTFSAVAGRTSIALNFGKGTKAGRYRLTLRATSKKTKLRTTDSVGFRVLAAR